MAATLDVVTGAFSYSGAAITRKLHSRGRHVRTLTGHPHRAPAESAVDVHQLDFSDEDALEEALQGAHTLYNTYWVRFPRGELDHDTAVANTHTLFASARRAGVQRIVHISILNPRLDSPFSYFRGKAEVERDLASFGVPYAIVRPAVLFGGDGVLVNNIAWLLRTLPVFAIGRHGTYRIRPIHVDDLAHLCVELGAAERADNTGAIDAVGPQSLAFRELVEAIRAAVGSRAALVPVPHALMPALARVLSLLLRDTLLTPEEYRAMVAGLADSAAPATGTTKLTEWVAEHGAELGRHYINDRALHYHDTS